MGADRDKRAYFRLRKAHADPKYPIGGIRE